jgi:hypothetical protein
MEKAGRRPRYRGKNPRSFSEKYNIEPPHNDNIDVASACCLDEFPAKFPPTGADFFHLNAEKNPFRPAPEHHTGKEGYPVSAAGEVRRSVSR